jgi:uncharacterized membrane protein YkoI
MKASDRKASTTALVTSSTKSYAASIAVVIALASVSTSALWATDESQEGLKAEAKVSQEVAAHIALARVPGGRIKSAELEREHGTLIWSFDISKPQSKDIAEVQVDAKTGRLVAQQTETPKQQALEATVEKH